MLQRLINDHKHIGILVSLLEKKCMRLADGEAVNFNLIRDILEYMQVYVEHSHHPLEEIIYEYYLNKVSAAVETEQLAAEHKRLFEASSVLMASLNLILSDVVVARDKLIADLQNYVALQRRHMAFEETEIFPLFSEHLNAQDWADISASSMQRLVDDPLFSDNDKQVFEELRDYLLNAE
ncbi:hemerythrin domain-containing protein [Shewanella sp. AS16]|uniref:hemerythrin domain-containing protein n=1 Tax=Shewanella sp. AS16 TaxID=2907625 RepID=UPI001F40AD61|nr:hemerythrin domain-containing protein [Shewanella sp. AS16]MCE9685295.1 hemerythrin domain-containing protein [Shewanella sp. AS16]